MSLSGVRTAVPAMPTPAAGAAEGARTGNLARPEPVPGSR